MKYLQTNIVSTFNAIVLVVLYCICLLSNNVYSQNNGLNQDSINKTAKNDAFYKIREIHIEGNKRTKPSIIRRELIFKEGDSVRIDKVDSLLHWERNKIFNTNLFVTVDVNLYNKDSLNNADLLIKVKEQWYTIPQLILEPSDRNLNEWLFQYGANLNRVNIGVKVFQKNVRGRNETLRMTLQAGFTRNYDVSYDIPYINKKQTLGMRIYFSYSNNRSMPFATVNHRLSFVKIPGIIRNNLRGGLGFNFRPQFFTTHSFEFDYNYNTIADTIATLNYDYFLYGRTEQRFAHFRYIFNYDKRDVKQFAHKGDAFKVEVEQLGFTKWESFNLTRLFFTYMYFKQFNKLFLFGTRFKTKTSFPIIQPYNEFRGLGYNQDFVRGYELYPIDGQHYIMNRNSFRLRIYDNIINFGKIVPIRQFRTVPVAFYFTVFCDWGYVYRTNPWEFDNKRFSNTLLSSIGAGINFVSYYNSVLRLETSYNRAGQFNFFFSMATDI